MFCGMVSLLLFVSWRKKCPHWIISVSGLRRGSRDMIAREGGQDKRERERKGEKGRERERKGEKGRERERKGEKGRERELRREAVVSVLRDQRRSAS